MTGAAIKSSTAAKVLVREFNCIKGLPQNRVAVGLSKASPPSCESLMAIAPPNIIQNVIQPTLANIHVQLVSAIDELYCPIWLSVLIQPIQFPCDRLVCAQCFVEWIHMRDSCCPCWYNPTPLENQACNQNDSL